MKDLRNWFANPFAGPKISYEKLKLFAADVIARLTNNNGSGLFTAVLAQLVAAYQSYFGDITDVDLASAIQKSFTASKDNLFNTFKAAVSRQEGLVRSTFGKDSPIYMEFFPLGLTQYSNATLANVETLMSRMAASGQAHVAELGPNFVNEFQSILTNYQAARTAQLGRKSLTSDERTERHSTRAELETQLFSAMFTVGFNYPGNVDRCMDFFDQTIIRTSTNGSTADDIETFTGDVEPMNTVTVTGTIQPTASITFKNTGPVGLMLFMSDSENGGSNTGMMVNPGQETHTEGTDLDPLKPFLRVRNDNPMMKGSYELTVDNG
ncbi:MAG: hypothetical protein KBF73_10025 [Flavobacteriales bacterium]|nr:hypothetical protein [Flavobacteriales bacterium]